MKILFTNNSNLIKYGLYWAFEKLGYEVKMMDLENQIWDKSATEQQILFEKVVNEFKPNLVFSEGFAGFDIKGLFGITKKYGIPHMFWSIEDPIENCWIGKSYSPYADYTFTTANECVDLYKNNGKGCEVLLFASNPDFHKHVNHKKEYIYDIVLVASNYSNRYEETKWFVMPLVEKGYNIKIWGIWWDDFKRPVSLKDYMHVYGGVLMYEELPHAYSSSKIILGMNCDDNSDSQTSMRPYEALGSCGGLLISHYTKAMKNIFGDYVYLPKNTQETFDMVNEVLNMSEKQRIEKAINAQDFVYKNHNYILRAEQIINIYRNKL